MSSRWMGNRNFRLPRRPTVSAAQKCIGLAALLLAGAMFRAPRPASAAPASQPATLQQTVGVFNVQFNYTRTDTTDETGDSRSGHTVDTWTAAGNLSQRVLIEPTGDSPGSVAFGLGALPPTDPSPGGDKHAEYTGTHYFETRHHDKDGSSYSMRTNSSFDITSTDNNNPGGIHALIESSDDDEKQCFIRFFVEGSYTEKTQWEADAPHRDTLDGPVTMLHTSGGGTSTPNDLHAMHEFTPGLPADAPEATRTIRAMLDNHYGVFPSSLPCSGLKTTYAPKNGWTVTFTLSQKNPASKTTRLNGTTTVVSGTETITLTARLIPGKPAPAKMIIAPNDATAYDNWLPLPASDDDAVTKVYGTAPPLSFTATLQSKEKGKDPPSEVLDFYLRNVSQNQGKCENDPRPGAAGGGSPQAGLRFAKNQPGLIVDASDPNHAYTSSPVTSASVVVEAVDTGAYGRLYAQCEDLGLVATYQRTNQTFIPVPRDDDNNHIAYAWEKQQGILGKGMAATSDDEDQPYSNHKGDGLSVYDQYRGFVVRLDDGKGNPIKKFQRIDLKSKNMFVRIPEDDPEAALYRKAVLQFSQITGFSMHFIYDDSGLGFDDGEVGKSPYPHWLNYNSDPTLAAAGCPRQYAVWILTKAPVPGNVFGRTVPIPPLAEDAPEIPKNVDYIGVFRDTAKKRLDDVIAIYPTIPQALATQPGYYNYTRQAWDQLHAAGKINDDLPAIGQYLKTNESALLDQFEEFTVIHELSHAAGVQHHHLADALKGPEGKETTFFAMGDKDCPMRYWADDLDLCLLEYDGKWNVAATAPDGTPWKFCDDECTPNFHLRD